MSGASSYTHDVFISYSTKNREWVKSFLLPRLVAEGLKSMVDYLDFRIGVPTAVNIEACMEACRHVLLVLTPAWVDSSWTELEQLITASGDPAGRQQRMLPLVLEPCSIPRRLSIFTYADLTSTDERARQAELSRVIRALKSRTRIFLAYSSVDPDDRALVGRLSAALAKSGHSVQTHADLPMGRTRKAGLQQVLAQCDSFVPLFSPAAVKDGLFAEQVSVANANPTLRVLPVRARYLEALPASMQEIIGTSWNGAEDDAYLIQRVLDALVPSEQDEVPSHPGRPPGVIWPQPAAPALPTKRTKGSKGKTKNASHAVADVPVPTAAAPLRRAREFLQSAPGAKLWDAGSAITIRFLDGEPDVQWRVAKAASLWLHHANLRFVFTDDRDAMLRIAFRSGDGSWAMQSKDALSVPKNEPTANFGWIGRQTSDEELLRTVVHEFGHVLGLVHEHQIANANIPWDRKKLLAEFSGPPNFWTAQEIEKNFLDLYPTDYFPVPKIFDPRSIMAFPIPPHLTDGKFTIDNNNVLSDGDKAFIAQLYP